MAQAPRSILEVPAVALRFRGDVGATAFKFETKFRGERFHESLVFVGLRAPQLMMKVQDEDRDTQPRAQLRENPQQRHGIRAARNAKAHAAARTNHAVALDGFKDSFLQI